MANDRVDAFTLCSKFGLTEPSKEGETVTNPVFDEMKAFIDAVCDHIDDCNSKGKTSSIGVNRYILSDEGYPFLSVSDFDKLKAEYQAFVNPNNQTRHEIGSVVHAYDSTVPPLPPIPKEFRTNLQAPPRLSKPGPILPERNASEPHEFDEYDLRSLLERNNTSNMGELFEFMRKFIDKIENDINAGVNGNHKQNGVSVGIRDNDGSFEKVLVVTNIDYLKSVYRQFVRQQDALAESALDLPPPPPPHGEKPKTLRGGQSGLFAPRQEDELLGKEEFSQRLSSSSTSSIPGLSGTDRTNSSGTYFDLDAAYSPSITPTAEFDFGFTPELTEEFDYTIEDYTRPYVRTYLESSNDDEKIASLKAQANYKVEDLVRDYGHKPEVLRAKLEEHNKKMDGILDRRQKSRDNLGFFQKNGLNADIFLDNRGIETSGPRRFIADMSRATQIGTTRTYRKFTGKKSETALAYWGRQIGNARLLNGLINSAGLTVGDSFIRTISSKSDRAQVLRQEQDQLQLDNLTAVAKGVTERQQELNNLEIQKQEINSERDAGKLNWATYRKQLARIEKRKRDVGAISEVEKYRRLGSNMRHFLREQNKTNSDFAKLDPTVAAWIAAAKTDTILKTFVPTPKDIEALDAHAPTKTKATIIRGTTIRESKQLDFRGTIFIENLPENSEVWVAAVTAGFKVEGYIPTRGDLQRAKIRIDSLKQKRAISSAGGSEEGETASIVAPQEPKFIPDKIHIPAKAEFFDAWDHATDLHINVDGFGVLSVLRAALKGESDSAAKPLARNEAFSKAQVDEFVFYKAEDFRTGHIFRDESGRPNGNEIDSLTVNGFPKYARKYVTTDGARDSTKSLAAQANNRVNVLLLRYQHDPAKLKKHLEDHNKKMDAKIARRNDVTRANLKKVGALQHGARATEVAFERLGIHMRPMGTWVANRSANGALWIKRSYRAVFRNRHTITRLARTVVPADTGLSVADTMVRRVAQSEKGALLGSLRSERSAELTQKQDDLQLENLTAAVQGVRNRKDELASLHTERKQVLAEFKAGRVKSHEKNRLLAHIKLRERAVEKNPDIGRYRLLGSEVKRSIKNDLNDELSAKAAAWVAAARAGQVVPAFIPTKQGIATLVRLAPITQTKKMFRKPFTPEFRATIHIPNEPRYQDIWLAAIKGKIKVEGFTPTPNDLVEAKKVLESVAAAQGAPALEKIHLPGLPRFISPLSWASDTKKSNFVGAAVAGLSVVAAAGAVAVGEAPALPITGISSSTSNTPSPEANKATTAFYTAATLGLRVAGYEKQSEETFQAWINGASSGTLSYGVVPTTEHIRILETKLPLNAITGFRGKIHIPDSPEHFPVWLAAVKAGIKVEGFIPTPENVKAANAALNEMRRNITYRDNVPEAIYIPNNPKDERCMEAWNAANHLGLSVDGIAQGKGSIAALDNWVAKKYGEQLSEKGKPSKHLTSGVRADDAKEGQPVKGKIFFVDETTNEARMLNTLAPQKRGGAGAILTVSKEIQDATPGQSFRVGSNVDVILGHARKQGRETLDKAKKRTSL